MGKNDKITVPPELQSAYFYHDSQIFINKKLLNTINPLEISYKFPYELAYYANYSCEKPWESDIISVKQLFQRWTNIEKELVYLFELRNRKDTEKLMKLGIAIFIQALFWTNNIPVTLNNQTLENLRWKPINIEERLQFILERPNFHHAFIQLGELIKELEKQYYIKNLQ